MNTYLIPIKEEGILYIKKIVAPSEQDANDKLFDYLYNKYDTIEGDALEDIRIQLRDMDVEFGQLYDYDELA